MGQEPRKESLRERISEGAHRVVKTGESSHSPVVEIAHDVDALRDELDRTLEELRRRRRRAFNMSWILHEHAGAVLAAAVGTAALGAFLVAYAQRRASKRNRWSAKAARMRQKGSRFRLAVSRAIDRPERVAPADPTLGHRLLERAAMIVLERGLSVAAERARVRALPPRRSA